MRRKTCCICGASFIPIRKVGNRQKTCGSAACRQRRKYQANARWREANPEYGRNDYPRLKEWLDHHPGYLKRYRQEHPDYVRKNRDAQRRRDRERKCRLDIQAALLQHPTEIIRNLAKSPPTPRLDIQDALSLKPLEITLVLARFAQIPCLDIQAEMDFFSPRAEHGAIPSGGGSHGCTMDHRS